MITHFLLSEEKDEDRPASSKKKSVDPWINEYKEGRKFHLTGFMVNSNYAGITFAQFAILATKRSITPIASQIDGKIQVAPDHTLEAGDVIFALVRNAEDLVELRDNSGRANWREAFKERQTQVQGRAKNDVMLRQASVVDGDKQGRSALAKPSKSFLNVSGSNENMQESRSDVSNAKEAANATIQTHPVFKMQATTAPSVSSNARSASSSSPGVRWKANEQDGSQSVEHKVRELEAKAQQIAEVGGHHILVLLQGAPWQQVQVFLNTLRADHLPFHIPILVLIPAPLPHPEQIVAIFGRFPHTAFMRSLAHGAVSIYDLRNCGMTKARGIALLAGNAGQASSTDRRMVDGAGVTLLACIEGEIMEINAPSVPVFLELHQQESVRFLTRFFERDAAHAGEDDGYDPSESFTFHPRFANGNIFTASCFGATVARSYNMPGIVELMEAITLGTNNGQKSFPWQVSVPAGYEGRPYGELVRHFLETSSAVCLGIFRLCFPDDSQNDGPRFVMTNPEQSTDVLQSDYFFVLGSAEFGRQAWGQDLLPGTEGAPAANEPEQTPSLAGPLALPLPPVEDWPEGPLDLGAPEAQLPHLRTPSRGRGRDGPMDGMYVFHPFGRTSSEQRTPLALGMGTPSVVPSSGLVSDAASVSSHPLPQ